jgi:MbtH protein
VNDAGQYSIWDPQRPLPSGWRADGFEGTRAACLSHVEEVWTDLTPLGVGRRSS